MAHRAGLWLSGLKKHRLVRLDSFHPVQAHLSCNYKTRSPTASIFNGLVKFSCVIHKSFLTTSMHFSLKCLGLCASQLNRAGLWRQRYECSAGTEKVVSDLCEQSWAVKVELWMQCWDWNELKQVLFIVRRSFRSNSDASHTNGASFKLGLTVQHDQPVKAGLFTDRVMQHLQQ